MKKNLFFFFTLILSFGASAQLDSNKLKHYIEQVQSLSLSNSDSAFVVCEEALQYALSTGSVNLEANMLGWKGYFYRQKGNLKQGLEYVVEGLNILKENNLPKTDIASAYTNLGAINDELENYPEALSYYLESLKIREEIGDLEGVSNSLYNIGVNYSRQKEYEKSIDYYRKGLVVLDSIGFAYGIAYCYIGLSSSYFSMGEMDSALNSTQHALGILNELGDKRGVAHNYYSMGKIYRSKNDINKAKEYAQKAKEISEEIGYPRTIKDASLLLYELYKSEGNYQLSLEHYEIHIQMRDSLNNEENQKAAIRQQTQYEFEKAQLVAEQQRNEELRVINEELQRRNNLQYSLILIGVVILFSFLFSLGKLKVSPLLAEGLIFFAFLILFEFFLVLGDPYIESATGGEPIYKLIANALLAGFIFPLHAFFERALKSKIVK